MASPQAIFVVGRNRSGTKWLSNIIANHSAVAAVQHPQGTRSGIVSTNLFDQFPRVFGDLRNNENHSGFLACFSETNFFRYSGLPREVLFERRHVDYLDQFEDVMNRLAVERGKSYWVQKASSLVLPRLQARFPEAKFIVIRRMNVLDNVRSSLGLHYEERLKPASAARVAAEVASYYLHRSVEQPYLRRQNFMVVEFESLKSESARIAEELCRFIGIPYQASMLEVGYAPNSSYSGRTRPEDVMTANGLALFRVLEPAMRALPDSLMRAWYLARERAAKRRYAAPRFIRGTFRLFRDEFGGSSAPKAERRAIPQELENSA